MEHVVAGVDVRGAELGVCADVADEARHVVVGDPVEVCCHVRCKAAGVVRNAVLKGVDDAHEVVGNAWSPPQAWAADGPE
eukprot:11738984-Heterocapsa_arctica.AAC.1